jgi:hypothetical protein
MAGEKFIALEETSQEIKTTVEGVSASVTELKEDVGDGAGTDLVARVANLATQVSNLQTAVEALANSGGGKEYIFRKGSTVLLSTDKQLTGITGPIKLISFVSLYNGTIDVSLYVGSTGTSDRTVGIIVKDEIGNELFKSEQTVYNPGKTITCTANIEKNKIYTVEFYANRGVNVSNISIKGNKTETTLGIEFI